MRRPIAAALAGAVCAGASVLLDAQAPLPTLTVVHPTETAVLSGRVDFEAVVTPPVPRVRYVAFFVDGVQICRVASEPYRCQWDAGSQDEPRSVRVVAEMVDGRRVVSTVRTSGRDARSLFFSASTDAITVPVRVRDGRGRPVSGLGADAFRITEDGTPQTVAAFVAGASTPSVLLALDMSGSMEPLLSDLRRSAEVFLDQVKAHESVSVAAFNSGLFVLARPGSEPAARRAALDRLRPWGQTALYDSLIRAVELVKTQPAPRAIVVFTDGDDIASRGSVESVRSAFLADDIVLYLVVRADEPRRGSAGAVLADIAERTGGDAWFTSRMSTLGDRFTEIVRDLSTRYVLSYTPARSLGDDGWRELKVEVVVPGQRYEVEARQGYYAAARTGGTR